MRISDYDHNRTDSFFLGKVKDKIIYYLYLHRQCTAIQLALLIYPEVLISKDLISPEDIAEANKVINRKRERINIELQQLKSAKYVIKKSFTRYNYTLIYWALNTSRIEEVNSFLKVNEKLGTGWKGDLGEQDSDKLKFTPKGISHLKAAIEVDFAIILKYFESEYTKESLSTDYINNHHAAKTYDTGKSNEISAFQPDGEFRVYFEGDSLKVWGWIEIYQGTVRILDDLVEMFARYEHYIQSTRSYQIAIPDHIFIVLPNMRSIPIKRIWCILNAYLLGMPNNGAFLNVAVTTTNLAKSTLLSIVNRDDYKKKLTKVLIGLMNNNEVYKGPNIDQTEKMYLKAKDILGWEPLFMVTYNSHKNVLLFLKFDCYECQGFARLIDFHLKFNKLSKIKGLKGIKKENIIPVFYSNEEPIGVVSNIFTDYARHHNQDEPMLMYFMRSIYYSVNKNQWYNEKLELMPNDENPLRYFSINHRQ